MTQGAINELPSRLSLRARCQSVSVPSAWCQFVTVTR